LAVIIAAALVSAPAVSMAAPPNKDARRIYDEATAAFGLGRYAEAAEKYEAAFSLRPDPALLYNAAQAYRLAGNHKRALELYRNYVRLYPEGMNAAEARSHVAALKKALDEEAAAAAAPPAVAPAPPRAFAPAPAAATPPPPMAPPAATAMPPPVETRPAAPLPPAPPPPASDANVAMVSRPTSQGDEQKPLTHQTWFWVAIGAAAVAVGATIVVLATRGETFPDASFGTARGN
jgi:tetratricopeptide (TPR) repeat protein